MCVFIVLIHRLTIYQIVFYFKLKNNVRLFFFNLINVGYHFLFNWRYKREIDMSIYSN